MFDKAHPRDVRARPQQQPQRRLVHHGLLVPDGAAQAPFHPMLPVEQRLPIDQKLYEWTGRREFCKNEENVR